MGTPAPAKLGPAATSTSGALCTAPLGWVLVSVLGWVSEHQQLHTLVSYPPSSGGLSVRDVCMTTTEIKLV